MVSLVLVILIIYKTFEVYAVREHVRTISNLACNKLIAGVDGCESRAAREHSLHISHIRSIEICDVERGEILAVVKHITHTLHISNIELGDVEQFETYAFIEHFRHIRHFLGIET